MVPWEFRAPRSARDDSQKFVFVGIDRATPQLLADPQVNIIIRQHQHFEVSSRRLRQLKLRHPLTCVQVDSFAHRPTGAPWHEQQCH